MHTEEYRFSFIRGRAGQELDSKLPLLIEVLEESLSGNDWKTAKAEASKKWRALHNCQQKTADNWITEIGATLLGLVTHHHDGSCSLSELAVKLQSDLDQPAFFKVLASRIQYPNPMNKRQNYERSRADGLHIRPLVLVLETLDLVEGSASYEELRTFILANRGALTGSLSPSTLAEEIHTARQLQRGMNAQRRKHNSRDDQHITELLTILEVSNLLLRRGDSYFVNERERVAINWIKAESSSSGLFREFDDKETYEQFRNDWSVSFGSNLSSDSLESVETPPGALTSVTIESDGPHYGQSTSDIGREGEDIIYSRELERVRTLRPQDQNHVRNRSNERGIGYDIQSVWCEGENPGTFKFIEVKTTKRSTQPKEGDSLIESITFTANEYRAAKTHRQNFVMCRVYLHQGGFEVIEFVDPISRVDLIFEPHDWKLTIKPSTLHQASDQG